MVYELIKQWIADCDKDHLDCKTSESLKLPFRLVQVDSDGIRLVDAPAGASYLTLSYCWGQSLPFKTTSDNIALMRRSVNFEALPRNFQDLIVLARNLKVKYVWVDSLCIVQDDPQDWQEQSTRMAMIYANAYLNISATAAPDCETGIFSLRRRNKESQMRTYGLPPEDFGEIWNAQIEAKIGWSKKTCTVLMREVFDHSDFTTISEDLSANNVPLLRRAWAMQERLLSRRTVHFGKSELIWECKVCARCECGRLDFFWR